MDDKSMAYHELEAKIERLTNIVRTTEVERDAADQVANNLRAQHEDFLLKAEREKNVLLTSLEAAMITIKRLKDPDTGVDEDTYQVMHEIYLQQIRRRNEIIRELMAWIDSEFRLDTYLPESPGKKLWDRANEAIQ